MGVTHIDLWYDPVEDRLHLAVRSGSQRDEVALTRRLTRGVVGGMADLLMRTSEDVRRAGQQHREQVIAFEHAGALVANASGQEQGSGATPVAGLGDPPRRGLVTQVDLSANPTSLSVSLSLHSGQRLDVTLGRGQAHKFLSMLHGKAREAGWELGDPAWLDCRANVVLPGSEKPN